MLKFRSDAKGRVHQLEVDLEGARQRAAIFDKHAGIGLWDIVVHNGDVMSTESVWNFSTEFGRHLGFGPGELPNTPSAWSDRIHPEDGAKVVNAFDAFIRDISGRTPFRVEYRIKMKDGAYRWFRSTGGCSRDGKGMPLLTCGSLSDIHEAKIAEERDAARNVSIDVFVRSIGAAFDRLAGGDLTTRMDADVTAEFDAIRQQFNDTIANLEKTIGAVMGATGSIRGGLEEINAASVDLSQRTEQQAASLEETVAALSEVMRAVNGTAEAATEAQAAATTAQKNAEKGGSIVSQAVSAMGEIERSSDQIGKIIGVIDEIAFQTNLLALNAGVEAARAGEAGRGFAVVAQEVRGLAQRSAEAAKEIKDLISASAAQVGRGVDLVTASGRSLEEIVSGVSEMSRVVSEIARSAKEQAVSLREVATAADQMDKVTQKNAAMVEETTAAARSLMDDTVNLSDLTDRFQTGVVIAERRPRRPVVAAPSPRPMPNRPMPQMRAVGTGGAAPKAAAAQDDWEEF